MATLTRADDVEGDLNCSVGTTDFTLSDAEPQYQTDDPDVIEFGHRSDAIEVKTEAPVEDAPADPNVSVPPAPVTSEDVPHAEPTKTTGAFS